MKPEHVLLAVLFFIYCSECFVLISRSAFILTKSFGRRWVPGTQEYPLLFGYRLVFENLLPGLGSVVVAELGPPLVSPAGLSCFTRKGGGTVQKYLEFKNADLFSSAGRDVLNGHYHVCTAATAEHAASTANLLNSLKAADHNMRESIIDSSFKRLLETRKASARWKAYRKISSLVLTDSWALFGVLVTLFLLLLFRFGLAATWPLSILAVIFLSHNIYAFYRTHSVFYRNRGQERWKQIVLMVLTPTSSIRASDMTVRELFAGLHFLAIGRVLLGAAQSRELTSKTLREMLHPVEVAEEHSSSPASEWARERWTRIVSDWAEKEFGDLKGLLAPPPKESARCIRYCPRCLTQYVIDQDNCADCPGITLISF